MFWLVKPHFIDRGQCGVRLNSIIGRPQNIAEQQQTMVRGKSAIRVLKMTIFMVVKRDDLLLIGNLLSRVVRFAPSSPIFTIEATCGRRTKISNAFEVVFVIVKEHEYMGGGQATKTVVVYFYAKYTHCSVG